MSNEHIEDERYLREISPAVLRVLSEIRFFNRLDDRLCPVQQLTKTVECDHTFQHSIEILGANGTGPDDIDEVLEVLRSRGACCDCEVLYNVADETRLKARYWKARYAETQRK